MSRFLITCQAGVDFGVYEGATAEEAFAAMVEDGGSGAEGSAADWHITEAPAGAVAYKYSDPTEGARWIFSQADADSIRAEDPSLLVWV